MATINSWGSNLPVQVAFGGTGQTTLPSSGILIGNGSSGLSSLSVGTNGQVLIGATTANPSWVTPSAGTGLSLTTNSTTLSYALISPVAVANGGTNNTTFTAYSVICAGTTATGTFQNVSGVGTSGQVLTSNGASNLPTWQAGVVGPVSSTNLAIATWNGTGGTALLNNSAATINASGYYTNTSQPFFIANLTNTLSGQTGDGTDAVFIYDTLSSGSGYSTSTGKYTVPIAGKYQFSSVISLTGLTSAVTYMYAYINLNDSVAAYFDLNNPFNIVASGAPSSIQYVSSTSILKNLSAADFIDIRVVVGGQASKLTNFSGGNSRFSGVLVT